MTELQISKVFGFLKQPALPFPATTGPAADVFAPPPQAPCNTLAEAPQTLGSLALAVMPEQAPAMAPAPELPAPISAGVAVAARDRDGAAKSALELLPPAQRAIIEDQARMAKEMRNLVFDQGVGWQPAFHAVAAHVLTGMYPALAERAATRKRAYSLGAVKKWMDKLGALGPRPPATWDMDRLAYRYREGAVKQSEAKALPEVFVRVFNAHYLTRKSPSIQVALDMSRATMHQMGMELPAGYPTYTQLRYHVAHRLPRRLIEKLRTPKAEKARLGGYLLRGKYAVGDIWIMDHHLLDLYTKVRMPDGTWRLVRPYITVVRDAGSGYILSALIYADSAPNHKLILECLWNAIVFAGFVLPMIIYIDNGKDFLKHGVFTDAEIEQETAEADRIVGLFADVTIQDGARVEKHSVGRELRIQVERAAPYKGRQKAVERDFRNVAHNFAKRFPTWVYRGHKPEARPQETPESNEEKQFDNDPARFPTPDQVQLALAAWLPEYHNTPSNGRILLGRTPASVWAERKPSRIPLDVRAVQLAMLIPLPSLYLVREGPSGADVWHQRWPYQGRTDADAIALRTRFRDTTAKVMLKVPFSTPTFAFGAKTLPMTLFAFEPDGRFVAELEAASEHPAFDASLGPDRDKFHAACRIVNVIKAKDREERDRITGGLRERHLISPAGQILPIGAGAVAAPVLPGPGRGRAKLQAHNADSAAADASSLAPSGIPSAEPPPTVKSDPKMIEELETLLSGNFGLERPEVRIAREAAALLKEEEEKDGQY